MKINKKLSKLRALMKSKKIDACIIPSSDPHGSEYVAGCWKTREWISGFTGSAGTVVVTQETAGLWTDFRYYIQAEEELSGSDFTLFRLGEPDVPAHDDWLKKTLSGGCRIGLDGSLFSLKDYEKLEKKIQAHQIELVTDFQVAEELWEDRPALPSAEANNFPAEYAGKTRAQKICDIRDAMEEKGAEHHLLSSLDDIAWTFNLRGSDIEYSPVILAYALISKDAVSLFVDKNKLKDGLKKELETDGLTLYSYESVYQILEKTHTGETFLLSPDQINIRLFNAIPEGCRVVRQKNIPTLMKAVKNTNEISGLKNALVKDGAAVCSFLYWLETHVGSVEITELSAADTLHEFRKKQDLFVTDSFNAIMAYQEHGAMCHYSADEKSSSTLGVSGLFLTDSGGHYMDGTTDITRTIALGSPTSQEIMDYTLVLKGHVAVARAVFPEGTRGYQIDTLARMAMWEKGINFGHGTGHGIGFYLNVHEGPHSISPHPVDVTLKEGMCVTNEPGIYRDGKHGIRIENIVVVTRAEETEFGQFLKFDSVTLCPYDPELIDKNMLTDHERNWINDYHRSVFEKIAPLLENDVKEWLKEKTRPL